MSNRTATRLLEIVEYSIQFFKECPEGNLTSAETTWIRRSLLTALSTMSNYYHQENAAHRIPENTGLLKSAAEGVKLLYKDIEKRQDLKGPIADELLFHLSEFYFMYHIGIRR